MTACELCRGACCESIILPLTGLNDDGARWFRYHGRLIGDAVELAAKCEHLRHGRCDCYDTRPEPCRQFTVGGELCVSTVKRRRPNQAAAILALLGSG
jgi:Fe-S-cluster containining protein